MNTFLYHTESCCHYYIDMLNHDMAKEDYGWSKTLYKLIQVVHRGSHFSVSNKHTNIIIHDWNNDHYVHNIYKTSSKYTSYK